MKRRGLSELQWIRQSGYYSALAVVLLAMVLAGGCAKKRKAPVPIPAPAPLPPGPEPQKPSAPSVMVPATSPGLVSLASPAGCQQQADGWWHCVHASDTGESLPYFLFLPSRIPSDTALPVVTFLHGSSGSGPGDGKALSGAHRFATALFVHPDLQPEYRSIVIAPQANPSPGETWVRAWRAPAEDDTRPKEALTLVMEILSALSATMPVDGRRLYMVGQSMGGFGAWLAYTRYPGRFAAIIPVCGGGDAGAVSGNPTAVWAFHGAKDAVVPVGRARQMVDAIERVGGNVRYTEYPELGHNIFQRVFDEPELLPWLFSQRLPE